MIEKAPLYLVRFRASKNSKEAKNPNFLISNAAAPRTQRPDTVFLYYSLCETGVMAPKDGAAVPSL